MCAGLWCGRSYPAPGAATTVDTATLGQGVTMRWIGGAFVAVCVVAVGGALLIAAPTVAAFVAALAQVVIFAAWGCVGTALFGAGVAGWWWVARTRHEHSRQRDGAFALREYWLDPWPRRIGNALRGQPSARVIVDINAMMSHAAAVGAFGVQEFTPAAGYDRQLTYLTEIEKGNRARAVAPGDNVVGNPLVSLQRGTMGVPNAATGRLLAGAYDRTPRPVRTIDAQPDVPQLPPPAVRVLTPAEAVAESSATALTLGQTEDGEVVRWDLLNTPHLRVHGATRGSGKTNVIQTAAAGALRNGAHVVVLDRVRFKDWTEFRHCAELVDTADPAALADANSRLLAAYHYRIGKLTAAGAPDISTLPNPPQRIIVVVSEFGAQCEVARSEGVINDVLAPLTQLLRLAAATGIHFIFEDQVTDRWPRAAIANATPVIGRMPDHAGQACGYHGRGGGTGQFAPYTFWFDGQMFRAPHMRPALPALLANAPVPRRLVMLGDPYTVRGGEAQEGERSTVPYSGTFQEGGEGSPFQAQNAPTPTGTVAQERNAGTATVDEPGRWDAVVAAWFARNPQALTGPAVGISDLARAMCIEAEGNAANYEAYKGRAHPLFHAFRAAVRPPNGERLGTDISTGGIAQ